MIGHGNVAVDVARMLLKDPEALAKTDMPTSVVHKLRENRIRKVSAVGRRGPAQVSFTTKEFREMVNLPGVKFNPIDPGLMKDARRMVEGDRPRKRLMDLMSKGGAGASGSANREFELGFLKSPMAFMPSSESAEASPKVSHIKWSLNTLLSPPAPPPAPPHPPAAPATTTDDTPSTTVVARPTGQEITTPSGLVIESVGYRSESLARDGDLALPFDEKKGRMVNEGGRVVDDQGIMVREPQLYIPYVVLIPCHPDTRVLYRRMGRIRSDRGHRIDHAIRVLCRIPHHQRPLHPVYRYVRTSIRHAAS